jgi:hypothetical protein
MRKKNIGPRRRRQDLVSRLDVGKLSRKQTGKLFKAAKREKIIAIVNAHLAGKSVVDQIAFLHTAAQNPDWVALLGAKAININITDAHKPATIIVGGDTKHHTGRSDWAKLEWVQSAFYEFYGTPSCDRPNMVKLTKQVNAWLTQQSDYRRGPVTRFVVTDAWDKRLNANLSPRSPRK